jgi:hypothetical protein
LFFLAIPPKFIVFSWHCARQLGDDCFQSPPKINFLQKGIHPSVDNTVIRIEVALMVNCVFAVTDDQPRALKESDDGIGFRVNQVRPLMKLVSQYSQDHCEYNCPIVGLGNE